MKKTTLFLISCITGLYPAWRLAFIATRSLSSFTQTEKIVNGKKMLYYMHPNLQVLMAVILTLCLIGIWYKLSAPIWSWMFTRFKSVRHRKDNGSVSKSLLTLGHWNAQTIVQIIFYTGLIMGVFPLLTSFRALFAPFGHARFSSLQVMAVLSLVLSLVLWKCACEALLIILRAFESYILKNQSQGSHASSVELSDENKG